jgi:phosphoglucomutase
VEFTKIYEIWREKATEDSELAEELEQIKGKNEEIEDRFYRDLAFGTGGLRGVIGAGTNRMNIYTVRKATQGLSDYLNENYEKPSVAIAYDSRKNSDVFSKTAAEVFAQNGIKVFIYRELMPTPMLSFAVRALKCSAGIVVTASHNPAKYNGYKVYGSDGCQITLDAAKAILGHIEKIDPFDGVKTTSFEDALAAGKIEYIGSDVIDGYFNAVYDCSVYGQTAQAGLKIVYSPLNGAGNKPVRRILQMIGAKEPVMVREQENPDPAFTTCPFPNPEEKEALQLGIELAEKEHADIVLATDPDCDRVGTAVLHNGRYVLVNGNQMGVMLLDFVCKMKAQNGTMPKKPVAIKTIVTSEMAQAVADAHGVALDNVLTGFKFIGEQIGVLEQKGEEGRYIFGFEESYGYLSGAYVRDKDAVDASMLIIEMAAYYKAQGKTLVDVLDMLYKEYGYYFDKLESFAYEGASGMQKMDAIMQSVRKAPPKTVGGVEVAAVCDYLEQVKYASGQKEAILLPSSDVIGLMLAGGSSITIRPSGTEPKLKVYYSLRCKNEEQSKGLFAAIKNDMNGVLGG